MDGTSDASALLPVAVGRTTLGHISAFDVGSRTVEYVAIASDEAVDVGGRALLPLNNPPSVVAWLRIYLDLPAPQGTT